MLKSIIATALFCSVITGGQFSHAHGQIVTEPGLRTRLAGTYVYHRDSGIVIDYRKLILKADGTFQAEKIELTLPEKFIPVEGTWEAEEHPSVSSYIAIDLTQKGNQARHSIGHFGIEGLGLLFKNPSVFEMEQTNDTHHSGLNWSPTAYIKMEVYNQMCTNSSCRVGTQCEVVMTAVYETPFVPICRQIVEERLDPGAGVIPVP